jgi:hypothetical protein
LPLLAKPAFVRLARPKTGRVCGRKCSGNLDDPSPLASQVNKLKERFALKRVVPIGDRG